MPLAMSRRTFVTAAATLATSARVSASVPADVSPEDYDALTDEQLGISNHVVHIATQPTGEWYGMGIQSFQGGDEGYRWQIGWWLQPLAITQYRLPAYRELYKRSIEGFLDKMAHRDTWSYWEDLSMGMAMNDSLGLPGRDKPTADPIARDNINYSANTMNLMTMHQMLYRDGKYLQPHSFLLKHWNKNGLEVFSYDLPKVAETLYNGFRETGWRGVACEVNGVYPAYCNQLALVAFKQYDEVVPGDMGARLIANHVKVWEEVSDLYKMGLHHPGAKEPYIPRAYYVKQKAMVALGDTLMTSAAYVNAWNSAWVRENYPYWKKRFSVEDGAISVKLDPDVRGTLKFNAYTAHKQQDKEGAWKEPGQAERGETPPFYYYAALSAAEMGDAPFLQAVRGNAAKFGNQPAWTGNEFFYDRNQLTGPERMSRGSSVLMTAAYLVGKDSFRTLYNKPWTQADMKTPQLEQVAWPDVLVRRAVFDKKKDALVITLLTADALRSSNAPQKRVKFAIACLDPARTYAVARDGKRIGRLQAGALSGTDGTLRWADGLLHVETMLGSDSSFVIQAV